MASLFFPTSDKGGYRALKPSLWRSSDFVLVRDSGKG